MNRNRWIALLIVSIPVLFLLGHPWVARGDEVADRFRELDANQDGFLDNDELKKNVFIRSLLRGSDFNQDGKISLDEVRTHLRTRQRNAAKAKSDAAPESAAPSPIWEAARAVPPAAAGIGRMLPDVALADIAGKSVRLHDSLGQAGLVIAFTNTSCPICKKYGPTWQTLEPKLRDAGYAVVYVNPTMNETPEAMAAFRKQHALQGAYLHDAKSELAKQLAASTTAEVFLFDAKRTLVYRGAVDDQYGLGYARNEAKQNYLLEAIADLKKNRPLELAATTAPGCDLDTAGPLPRATNVTYHNRISRIMQTHCIECHHTGGVGPFRLDRYEDVVSHAGMIRKVLKNGTMPPWFATALPDDEPHRWANDRSVPDADREDLLNWLASNRPQGNPADAPAPKSFDTGWMIGKPDAVYQFAKPVAVQANGFMPYQNVVVDTNLTEDRWVKAVEVRPSAREVVHHVLVFVITPGKRLDADERSGYFAIYVPGQSRLSYPDGQAKKIPKGARLLFQMHYTPNGTATEDRTEIGLIFADKTPEYEVMVAGVSNTGIRIPPNAGNHPEIASRDFPMNATITGFLPHMHLRGKAFRYEIIPPGKSPQTVLDIPRYDFNWQLYYRLASPMAVSIGTTVKATGWFDNSAKNPANPDPGKTVFWGPQTVDEMMLGYVEFLVPVDTTDAAKLKPSDADADAGVLFKRVDANQDGSINREEFDSFVRQLPKFKDNPEAMAKLFQRLDTNQDQKISPAELAKVRQ
ncbi:EF-hand domain-containing protein [Tuwongella immobilis]|uniref:Uncharacterized protein n=1 Tax=Tuwongella immobilis TaxID=692036 RepID=A0A6C2YJL8_9BACT|nr:EF-hand domain-containing protein [Tuwongella immobilis]VIP01305.1 thiol-disulfide oxidoreductase : Redoxin domain protein OS=Planctomyces brasiliensis (strain ATCC 49424 / DSM 5305 / JCM 21570 / NBRC 103401 / IFAM 1448) GN=Plabr_3782 PE=4 SV=1: EF-hand_5: EF-hand_5: AhpC-TSA: Cu2_monoox_C: EF-hand_7 [Tuwongella immobilis]VTR98036.1 thiol-disulfide oxidoreductase : Redoxin domain protein OS=Planctomyces brasiliensis (strain ATCC 49424 / DSM 5305 / JCM 21570 / NBRC 103401 / IFAM 1448) GN=Plabr_